MQKVLLSSDLTTLTTEIKSYQSIGGQAIFEIGRRLKWVKEHDLTHGEFGKWLESIQVNQRMAQQFIKISSELGDTRTSSSLGMQALYEIATMPESERDKPQQLPTGEVKKPDEMTVRELRETKRQLKARDSEIANKDAQIQKLSDRADKEPKVVEKLPDDYDMLKGTIDNLQATNKHYVDDNTELRSEIERLNNEAGKAPVLSKGLNNVLKQFIGNVIPMASSTMIKNLSSQEDIGSVINNIDVIKRWCVEIVKKLESTKIIEGDFKDEDRNSGTDL